MDTPVSAGLATQLQTPAPQVAPVVVPPVAPPPSVVPQAAPAARPEPSVATPYVPPPDNRVLPDGIPDLSMPPVELPD